MTQERVWVLVEPDGTEHGRYKGREPAMAARKIASRCNGTKDKPVILRLREPGTRVVRVYSAWKEEACREYTPPWSKAGSQMHIGCARYIGVEHITTPHHLTILAQKRRERPGLEPPKEVPVDALTEEIKKLEARAQEIESLRKEKLEIDKRIKRLKRKLKLPTGRPAPISDRTQIREGESA